MKKTIIIVGILTMLAIALCPNISIGISYTFYKKPIDIVPELKLKPMKTIEFKKATTTKQL